MVCERFGFLGAVPVLLLVACGGGGGGAGGGNGSPSLDGGGSDAGGGPEPAGSGSLTGAASVIPIAGELLATCLDTGVALIEGFVSSSPVPLDEAPAVSDVLALGDPDLIPVIGGLQASGVLGSLAPIDVDQALAQIPVAGLPGDLPVVGLAPVACSGLPTSIPDALDPGEAIGLVLIFDASGYPFGVLLATVGSAAGSPPTITDVTLPGTGEVLPQSLVSAVEPLVSSLLSPLGL
ncbi:MAG: hypothetical protein ACREQY_10605 [Candidatus Binatia bacterium]